MNAGDLCNPDVSVISPDATIVEAARRMREDHVGDLVVVTEEEHAARLVPGSILTDRDVAVSVVAPGLNPAQLLVREVVDQRPLVVVQDDESVTAVFHRMGLHGVRRLPVVDKDGFLVGIVTMDDLVGFVAENLGELSQVVGRQIVTERVRRARGV